MCLYDAQISGERLQDQWSSVSAVAEELSILRVVRASEL